MGGIDHPRYWLGAWVLWWRLYECPVSELNKISAKGRNGGKKIQVKTNILDGKSAKTLLVL